ncbi:cell division protein ZapA [Thiohalobacter sp. IOR34]|uniref:cell division protein ZapA n=1 Tax=Thiohalobacter sp. IOR34 TaxID=3057176 RepID=UPI0025B262C3|nr:cell division protein ZapA [Thiohalobacter sp. IOR34]WJW75873.1 cell division protein ZapA [Thiohalobacter sp. IOR34]
MNAKGAPRGVSVRILDKEYMVACGEDERDALIASAEYLNGKMREIRDSGKVIGIDRIAVMAALNLAHELLLQQNRKNDYHQTMSARIRSLQEKIEVALNQGNQLEF